MTFPRDGVAVCIERKYTSPPHAYKLNSARFGTSEINMTNLYHAKNADLVPVSRKRLANEDQLQAWIAANPKLIGLDVLVLGREVRTDSGARIDILARHQLQFAFL